MKKIIAIVTILVLSLFYQISDDQIKVIKQLNSKIVDFNDLQRDNRILKKLVLKEDFNKTFCVTHHRLRKILDSMNIQQQQTKPNLSWRTFECFIGTVNTDIF